MSNQVLIEIYNPNTDEIHNRILSRKLALLCYFLNTRLDSNNLQFVHGGVFGKQFTNSYNPVEGTQTIFEVVVNKKYVINDAFYFENENYSEEEMRALSQHFIQTLGGLSQEFTGFVNYKFYNREPIIVGNYYLRESGVDGRTLTNNVSNYQNFNMSSGSRGSQYQTGSVTVTNQTSQNYQNVSVSGRKI